MSKKTKQPVRVNPLGLSNYPAPNRQEAKEVFLSKVTAKDGSNLKNTLKLFLQIMENLQANQRSFDTSQVVYNAKCAGLESEMQAVLELFEKYTRIMVGYGILDEVETVYENVRLFVIR